MTPNPNDPIARMQKELRDQAIDARIDELRRLISENEARIRELEAEKGSPLKSAF